MNQVIMSVQSAAKIIFFSLSSAVDTDYFSCVCVYLQSLGGLKERRDNIFPFDKLTRALRFISKSAVKSFVGYLLISKS
jgi:hypothetical protein